MKKLNFLKKLAFIAILVLFANEINAQNNLQFNKAIFYEIKGDPNTNVTNLCGTYVIATDTLTIDSNKIWKIESSGINSLDNCNNKGTDLGYIMINNKIISGNGGSGGNSHPSFPIWLPAGTYYIKVLTPTLGFLYGYISAIEFNVVQ